MYLNVVVHLTCITEVPTFAPSGTEGWYWPHSGNLGALLLISFTSTITKPRLLRLIFRPQHRPLSVAVIFNL